MKWVRRKPGTRQTVPAAIIAGSRKSCLLLCRRWRQHHDLPLHVRRGIRDSEIRPPPRPPRLGLLQRSRDKPTSAQVHQYDDLTVYIFVFVLFGSRKFAFVCVFIYCNVIQMGVLGTELQAPVPLDSSQCSRLNLTVPDFDDVHLALPRFQVPSDGHSAVYVTCDVSAVNGSTSDGPIIFKRHCVAKNNETDAKFDCHYDAHLTRKILL